ncbi:hypothetical protein [Zoogloea ramigera]|jgi:hypothetical protein|uniref:hypothetical protein n=1 Tax=Zoogloea ramigera TaxID=350 RepID=UPI003FA31385
MPAASSPVEVVVTVDEAHLPQLAQIADKLAAKGLTIGASLAGIGMITGQARPDALPALRKVAGVAAVEQGGEAHIAPPDSEIQ